MKSNSFLVPSTNPITILPRWIVFRSPVMMPDSISGMTLSETHFAVDAEVVAVPRQREHRVRDAADAGL